MSNLSKNPVAIITGGSRGIGAATAADANDYDRLITKFGPTGIVDKCMANRGYNILIQSQKLETLEAQIIALTIKFQLDEGHKKNIEI